MFQGNWKCSKCGGAITELPFEPRGEAGLTCRDCYSKSKGNNTQSASSVPDDTGVSVAADMSNVPENAEIAGEQPLPPDFASMPAGQDKPKHTGDWTCAGCGAAITNLPFVPRSTENLKCLDCFKKSKA